MADVLNRCGDKLSEVKRCLAAVKNYPGVSGTIGINSQHDGIRSYVLKRVREDGHVVKLR